MTLQSEPPLNTTTPRLRISPLTTEDSGFIERLYNCDDFIRYIGDRQIRSLRDAELMLIQGPMASYQHRGFGLWRVALRECDTPIGVCGLIKRPSLEDIDLGYALLPEYHGRGYAREAAQAVLAWAPQALGVDRLVAITQLRNAASIRLLEGLGFRYERLAEPDDSGEPIGLYGLSFSALSPPAAG